jgi:murein DD-endopeptidase MepM/ murein hydrolase activator NlpD
MQLGKRSRHPAIIERLFYLPSLGQPREAGRRDRTIDVTIHWHARTRVRHLFRARLMTPARLAVLGVSLLVLVAAVWLVFFRAPGGATPAPTSVAISPSATASSTASSSSFNPQSSEETGSPETSPSADQSSAPTSLDPLLKEVPAHSVDPAQLTGYVWPVKHGLITTRFAPELANAGGFVVINGVTYHDGLDLATHCNDTVYAAHDGTVLYAGRNFDPYVGYQGNAQAIYDRLQKLGRTNEQPIVVVIDDGDGYRSEYVHLNQANVEPGQVVKAGDEIGLEGATGFATGCHLHYSLIRMDGSWQQVVPYLLKYGYPPLVRERVDPLDVLPWGDPDAPQRLQDKVNPPSPTTSSEPTEPTSSPSSAPGDTGSPTPFTSPSN